MSQACSLFPSTIARQEVTRSAVCLTKFFVSWFLFIEYLKCDSREERLYVL